MSFRLQLAACRNIHKLHGISTVRPLIYTIAPTVVHLNTVINVRNYHIANTNRHVGHQPIVSRILLERHFLSKTSVRSISDLPANAATAAVGLNAAGSAVDAPAVIVNAPEVTDLVLAAEPTLASIGLGGYWPVGIIQSGLEVLHVNCGLPWWLSIVIATLCVRSLVFPVYVYAQRNAARLKNNLPEMQALQKKLEEARKSGDHVETTQCTHDLAIFTGEKGCNPLKSLLTPLIQAPVFISFFFAISQMVNAPVESLHTGGMLWFPDLISPDSYYLLPAMMSTVLAINIELGLDKNSPMADKNAVLMKRMVRILPFVTFPFTMNFAAAMLCYWTTTNLVSLIQIGIFKIDAVRDFFKIDRLIVHKASAEPDKEYLTQEVFSPKNSFANIKLSKERELKRQRDYEKFLAAQKAAQNRTTVESERSKKRI